MAYQIPISAGQITQMVQSDLQGATVESVYAAADAAVAKATETFQDQAKGLYPALAAQISPRFDGPIAHGSLPQRGRMTITGVPASTMQTDITSGVIVEVERVSCRAATTRRDRRSCPTRQSKAEAGQPQVMTLDQWKTYLMQNPQYGFSKTQGGQDMAEQMSAAILNTFGRVDTTSSPSPVTSLYSGQSDLSANTSST